MSIIHTYDPDRDAVINPAGKARDGMPKLDAIIVNFSYEIMDALMEQDLLEVVAPDVIRCVSKN